MPWTPTGDATCDTCGHLRFCPEDRALAVQMMRAGGWRHMKGTTEGGREFETILCPRCAKDEKRRTRSSKETIEQEELPLDFEAGRVVVGKQGFSSR